MSDDTKATISILTVISIFCLIFFGIKLLEFKAEKQESLVESYNNDEEIFCSNDNKWELVNKSKDWKLVGSHFVKENVSYNLAENCEKNDKAK